MFRGIHRTTQRFRDALARRPLEAPKTRRMRRPHMTFSGSSAKAALSDEGSLNEESPCKESKLAEPFCEEAFEGWPLGEAPCLPASAASDANAGTTVFAPAAASLDAATGLTAFAGAPVGPTTFAGAIAATGFPQFMQNFASREASRRISCNTCLTLHLDSLLFARYCKP